MQKIQQYQSHNHRWDGVCSVCRLAHEVELFASTRISHVSGRTVGPCRPSWCHYSYSSMPLTDMAVLRPSYYFGDKSAEEWYQLVPT